MVCGIEFWGWLLGEKVEEEFVGVLCGGQEWCICLSVEDFGWALRCVVHVEAFGCFSGGVDGEGD